VTVAAAGDYGKPRPAVVVQTDANAYVLKFQCDSTQPKIGRSSAWLT
jgi:hypothetical protein